jgi:hypothetical protein
LYHAAMGCAFRALCEWLESRDSGLGLIVLGTGWTAQRHLVPQLSCSTPTKWPPENATHKHPKVCEWLEAHPWWTFHFTPTSASWLNAVEGFFAKLTKRRLARGIFHSVEELKEAIDRFLAENNQDPRPFQWIKKPSEILAAVKRGHRVLDSIH